MIARLRSMLALSALDRWRSRRRGSAGSGPEGTLDVRLLGAALLVWAVLAALLAAPRVVLAAVAVGGAVAGTGLARVAGRGRIHHGWWRFGALVLMCLAILCLATATHRTIRAMGGLPQLVEDGASAVVVGEVTGDPVLLQGKQDRGQVVLVPLHCESLLARGSGRTCNAPLLLRGGPELLDLRWHERVRVPGLLRATEPAAPQVGVLVVKGPVLTVADPGPVAAAAESLRAGLRQSVQGLPPDARGLLPGLVIGDTSMAPADLVEAMRAAGLTHLTAVSGTNVSVVLACALGLAAIVGLPRRARMPFAALVLAGFVVLARPQPSVVRAAAMGAVGLVGLSRARRARGPAALGAAIVLLLVWDPWLARSFGFALSTLATLGLLIFARPWGQSWSRAWPPVLRPLGPALAVPVAAQVACAPVLVLLQGSITLVAIPANLLAAPLVAPATMLGVTTALVAPVWPRLAVVIAHVASWPTSGIAMIAREAAQFPGGSVPWSPSGGAALALTVVIILAILSAPAVGRAARSRPTAMLASAALVAGVAIPTSVVTWPDPSWRLAFCDVGQGDAAVARSGPNSAVVIDVGPEPTLVLSCLRRLAVDRVEAIVLTHFHEDHVGGLSAVLGHYVVGEVLVSPVAEPAYQVGQARRLSGAAGAPVRELAVGERLDLGWVHAQVWSPARRIDAGSVPNNGSVVLALQVAEVDALLCGDIEREAAHDLLLRMRRNPSWLSYAARLDVVKSPHHGSANLDAEFMAQIRAPVAVISVGRNNDYGHPAPEHLAMLGRLGATVLRTDERGDIAVLDRDGVVQFVTRR